MATGNDPNDVTHFCCVCLEPYKGRSPKLLPCFHTLCLPCLKDLENHHKLLQDPKSIEEEKANKRPLTFLCPTCRTVITIPPGGVTQFQTNFYLNDAALTCEVCNPGQVATYNCTDCGHNMCGKCKQSHDNCFCNHQVQPLNSGCQTSCQHSLDEQLAVLEAALVTMREEEDTLQRERQAMADAISRRADAVRALVAQAEARSQTALVKAAENLAKLIRDEIITARNHHARIWQLLQEKGTKGEVNLYLRKSQTHLCDDDFLEYKERCSKDRQTRKLMHQFSDCALNLQAIETYLGTVFVCDQPADEPSSILESASVCSQAVSAGGSGGNIHIQPTGKAALLLDVADIKLRLKSLESSVLSGCKHSEEIDFQKFKEENYELKMLVAALKEEEPKIQHNMTSLKEDIFKMRTEMASMQQSLMTLTSRLQKDIDTIYKFQDDLSQDLNTFKEKSSILVAFNGILKEDRKIGSSWEIIVMDVSRCNLGQAYDEKTGVFTAPVTGTYFFLARGLRRKGPGMCALFIAVDGCGPASCSHDGELQAGVTCTVHVVQRLTQGQRVTLKALGDVTLQSYATSFSGVLIRPEISIV